MNPLGAAVAKAALGSTFSTGTKPSINKPAGSDGVIAPGGYLITGERNARVSGDSKWVTYDNAMANISIVAAAVLIWLNLGGSSKFTATPNKRGGKDAQRAADIVTEGLLEAKFPSGTWRQIVKRQLLKKFRGFAMHEAIPKRRADGMIVFGDIQHRPQWTVARWDKPTETDPWQAIEQRTRMGATFVVPRERLFYSVEGSIGDAPDGVGLLRHLVEDARVLGEYKRYEGIAFQSDADGMPVGRAPLAKLAADAVASGIPASDTAAISAYVTARVTPLSDMLEGHNKQPNQYLLLDSTPYESVSTVGAKSPSSLYQWSYDVVHAALSNQATLGSAIGRLTRDMARVMCAEWLLLGGEDSGGSYGMHADKTAMFGAVINGTLDDICDDATRDLATRLMVLNGLDPDTCTPTLEHEPVATHAVEDAARTLVLLSQAGLRHGDKAGDILRGRMDLPPAPELDEADLLAPRGFPFGGKPGAGPGDDEDGDEVDTEDTDDDEKPDDVDDSKEPR